MGISKGWSGCALKILTKNLKHSTFICLRNLNIYNIIMLNACRNINTQGVCRNISTQGACRRQATLVASHSYGWMVSPPTTFAHAVGMG